ncbi:MAG: endonuclease, partial [Pseudomonadota bacterium]
RGPGAEGVAKVEQSERMINKLRLLGHPDQFSRKLVRDAELSIDGRRVLERVLGDRDFVSSSFLLKAAALTTAIGRVSIGGAVGAPQGFGTGFLISPNLLMTNNHVIPSADWAAASHIEFDYGLDSEDQETLPIKVRFRPDVFFVTSHETELDYTVVALNVGDQDLGRPWIQLLQESGKALIKDRVNIIQHPKGRRQEVVVRNNRVTFVDNNKPYAHYEADTEGGSSGSPVFNDHWQLAFLHHASVPEKDSNGLILKKNGEPFRHGDADEDINWISNEGIRISKIVEDLKVARLSSSQERMLKEAFKDPDLTDYVHISRTHDVGPAERSAHLQRTTGTAGQQGPLTRRMTTADGRTSWLFELSFGPAGGESAWSGGQASGRGGYHHPAQTDNVRDGPPPPNVSALFGSSSGPSDADLREAVRTLIENAALEDEYYPEDRDEASKAAYYVDDDLDGGEVALFRRHHDLARINHRNVFSYARARHKVLYPWADRHEDDSLKSIYSGVRLPAEEIMVEELSSMLVRLPQPRESTINPLDYLDFMLDADDAFDVLESGTLPFNCEHVVPQSWFDKRQPMKADLHHLFTCEPGCNSFRSNLPYGEFENYSPEPTPVEEALRDQCGFRETLGGSDAFEPQHGKGAAARATLYFLLRYPGEIGDEGGEFSVERISTLLKWHEDDPVTDYERHRNRAIFLTQGNRNPVIDFPDLAGKIAFRKGIGG